MRMWISFCLVFLAGSFIVGGLSVAGDKKKSSSSPQNKPAGNAPGGSAAQKNKEHQLDDIYVIKKSSEKPSVQKSPAGSPASKSPGNAGMTAAQNDILNKVQTIVKRNGGTLNARTSVPKGLNTSFWEVVARGFSGNTAKAYDASYNESFDYLTLSTKAAAHAAEFARNGDTKTAERFLDLANKYSGKSWNAWIGASEQLDATYESAIAKTKAVHDAANEVEGYLGIFTGPAVGAAFDAISLGTDYIVNKALKGTDEANRIALRDGAIKLILSGDKFDIVDLPKLDKTLSNLSAPEYQKLAIKILAKTENYVGKKGIEESLKNLEEVSRVEGAKYFVKESVSSGTSKLLYKPASFDAAMAATKSYNRTVSYLPTHAQATVKAKQKGTASISKPSIFRYLFDESSTAYAGVAQRINPQDAIHSVAHIDPGLPNLNVSQQTLVNNAPLTTPIDVVLRWGATPSDLDLHLTGPGLHVYYANRGSLGSSPFASLDRDDTTSFGPETMTVNQFLNGTYAYSVHDYTNRNSSNSAALSNSSANVQVRDPSGLLRQYTITPNQGGTLWRVLEINGSTGGITTVNSMSYHSNPSTVP